MNEIPSSYLPKGGNSNPSRWNTAKCEKLVSADFTGAFGRAALKPYLTPACPNCGWGSWARQYPPANSTVPTLPLQCSTARWARKRFLAAATYFIGEDYNYCHHHTVWWDPMTDEEGLLRVPSICGGNFNYNPGGVPIVPEGGGCSPSFLLDNSTARSQALLSKSHTFMGTDCSSYSSLIYNFAFGAYFNPATGIQACGPTTGPNSYGGAPGTTRAGVRWNSTDLFQPGDLLYITPRGLAGAIGDTVAGITHVIMWTRQLVDFDNPNGTFGVNTLLQNLPADNVGCSQRSMAQADIQWMRSKGMPVYVITDSHWNGPNYRPYAGWYIRGFSHVRRVIYPASLGKQTSLPYLQFNSSTGCTNTKVNVTGYTPW